MNLTQLTTELKMLLVDPTVESSLTAWLNESVVELAAQFELPGLKLKLPAILTTTTAAWQYRMSQDVVPPVSGHTYMKNVFRVTNAQHERGMVIHREIETIDRRDPDHDETAAAVNQVAIEDETDDAVIAIYPKANDTLNLWYYRRPVDMSFPTDVPDGIPEAFHRSVLLSKVVLKAFRVYPELALSVEGDNTRALARWEGELRRGLYGDGYQIGLIDMLKKSAPPRIRGPKSGGNLAGADQWSTRSTR